jgi:hypothetical protein
MKGTEIIASVRNNVEPRPARAPDGPHYCVSASLTDGTILPCVVIEGAEQTVDLAIKRFDDTRKSKDPHMSYRNIVKTFVAQGNRVNDYDLNSLSVSSHAIPLARMKEIGGETSMSWTEFYALMKSGKEFRVGTTFLTECFAMPDGYTASDIIKITPAPRGDKPRQEKIYRKRPFFMCYVEGL